MINFILLLGHEIVLKVIKPWYHVQLLILGTRLITLSHTKLCPLVVILIARNHEI
jgi:hypothetical protein